MDANSRSTRDSASGAPFGRRGSVVRRAVLLAIALLAGCSTHTGLIAECPLTGDQQQQAVLEIAPIGTPRDDCERALRQAGIEFTAGSTKSIGYCTLWDRPDGERWRMNVALLFDAAGKLYGLRSADADTGIWSEAVDGKGPPVSRAGPAARRGPVESPAGEAAQSSFPETDDRVPFVRRPAPAAR